MIVGTGVVNGALRAKRPAATRLWRAVGGAISRRLARGEMIDPQHFG
jgi:hypothetical protein